MLNRTNQNLIIKQAINYYLDKGITNKQEIYTKVVDKLGVPRPTVRRIARELRNELLLKIHVLQSDMSEFSFSEITSEFMKVQEKSVEEKRLNLALYMRKFHTLFNN